MSRGQKNAEAAVEWARQRREKMERARQLREERKRKAEGGVATGPNGSTGFADFMANNGNMGPKGNSNGPAQVYPGYGDSGHNDFSQKSVPSYSQPSSNNFQRSNSGYGSSNYRPTSNEDIAEARQSLVLLKSKMKVGSGSR